MGEENNLLGIVDNATGIVNMQYPYNNLIDGYLVNRPDFENISNSKGELAIPEKFDKVLKKSIECLEEIKIESYEKIMMYDPATFVPLYKYKINLVLIFSWDTPSYGNTSKLQDMINEKFSFVYTEIDNFHFNILRVTTKERDFDKEFFEFFMKK